MFDFALGRARSEGAFRRGGFDATTANVLAEVSGSDGAKLPTLGVCARTFQGAMRLLGEVSVGKGVRRRVQPNRSAERAPDPMRVAFYLMVV